MSLTEDTVLKTISDNGKKIIVQGAIDAFKKKHGVHGKLDERQTLLFLDEYEKVSYIKPLLVSALHLRDQMTKRDEREQHDKAISDLKAERDRLGMKKM